MTEVTAPVKKRTRIKHLTEIEKAEAIALWKSGTVTIDDLCKRFKRERSTFLRLFKEAGAEKGETKAETERIVKEAVETVIVDEAMLNAKRVKDTREEHFRYISGIAKLTWNVIVKAQTETRVPATFVTDMKALELAARVFKVCREEKFVILGVRDDDDAEDKPMPDLVVQELSAQDIQRLHEQSLMADDELGLNETLGDEDLIGGELPDDEDERVEEN